MGVSANALGGSSERAPWAAIALHEPQNPPEAQRLRQGLLDAGLSLSE